MANLVYDKALSFGKLSVIATGAFPDTLDLVSTEAGRMTVDVCCLAPAGGTGLAVTVQGSADGSTGWADVGKNTFTLADMKAGPCRTAVSPNKFRHLRVSAAATGAFTGSAEAFLNTYAGK